MRESIVEMHCGEEVLLVGRHGALSHLPPAIRDAERGSVSLGRALASPENMRKLRRYWRLAFPSVAMSRCSDRDLARMAEAAVRNRRLHVALLRRTWPHQPPPRQPGRKAVSASAASSGGSANPLVGSGRHTLGKTGSVMLGDATDLTPTEMAAMVREDTERPGADPVTSWSMERRFLAVIRMAIEEVPSEMRNTMAALLSPDSIALMIGLMAVAAAANLTPFGWAADAVILGIAYAAGGMIAVHAAGNLFRCFVAVQNAQTKTDLEHAAELLAGAIVEIGVIGVMAILHRFSKGSEGDAGDMKAVEKPTRRSVEEQKVRRPKSSSSESQQVHKPPAKEQAPKKTEAASAEAGSGKFGYTVDKPPPDLEKNPGGVYGYTPKKGSQFDTEKGWPDWTDPEAVAKARATRLEYHQGLANEKAWVEAQRAAGKGEESIARELVDMRNKSRLSHYKPEELEKVYAKNLKDYGNPLGPSYESQLAKYGTPQAVIEAATRSNRTMDVLTGVAKVK
jgi:hypothetical protein